LRIAVFFAVSCAFTWWTYGIALITGNASWEGHFAIGPLVAGILVISITEGKAGMREWWRRISRVRGPVRFYVIAAAGPTVIVLASAGIALLAGVDAPGGSLWLEGILSSVILLVPMALAFGPVGEELAFRGWGQYRLQSTMSPFAAALLIGVGVIVWHLPLIATGSIPASVVIALPAVSVVYAWLYRMSGTVWTAVVLHTFLNVVNGVYVYEIFDGGADDLRFAIVTVGFIAWAAYIVVRYGTSLIGKGEARPTSSTPESKEFAPLSVAG
jgi:membrane protease YdiL (CAAX protease family)